MQPEPINRFELNMKTNGPRFAKKLLIDTVSQY